MSSTSSSDQLTLLSYATFNYNIPIHDHSWREHQWMKQTETMVALASLASQSAKKLLRSSFIFFLGHFLRQWNLSLWRLLCSLVHSKTQHLKIFFGADIVYLQQLQQVISKKAEVDCSFSLRAVFMLTGQRHKWAGLFPLCDVNRGRIWNSSLLFFFTL